MSKNVAIVNVSNWEGEDIIVQGENMQVTLRPGEYCSLPNDKEVQLTVIKADRKDTPLRPMFRKAKDFPERDVQMFPELSVLWRPAADGKRELKFREE